MFRKRRINTHPWAVVPELVPIDRGSSPPYTLLAGELIFDEGRKVWKHSVFSLALDRALPWTQENMARFASHGIHVKYNCSTPTALALTAQSRCNEKVKTRLNHARRTAIGKHHVERMQYTEGCSCIGSQTYYRPGIRIISVCGGFAPRNVIMLAA